jgi:hypothetical protein
MQRNSPNAPPTEIQPGVLRLRRSGLLFFPNIRMAAQRGCACRGCGSRVFETNAMKTGIYQHLPAVTAGASKLDADFLK